MPLIERPGVDDIRIRFGGGLRTSVSPLDILESECQEGKNFSLRVGDRRMTRRAAFDLAGTSPNASAIRGFAQLQKSDDTISTLVQSGTQVYEWDGADTFTLVGSVAAGARLRGHVTHNWPLSPEFVIITDLEEKQPVMKWDGTTFSVLAHNLSGDFFARYCVVANERAYYFNVKATTSTPHLVVVSKVQDAENLTTTTQAGDAGIGVDDAFFLPSPDLKYINGAITAFGIVVFSTRRGRLYKFTGSDATDFVIDQFYPQSGAAGREPIAFIGNDVAYGRPGRVETVFATEKFGDVAADDLSNEISPDVRDIDGWDGIHYLSRFQKVYCFPEAGNKVFVLHKDFVDERIRAIGERRPTVGESPWSVWDTQHALDFRPEAVMTMRDPRDGLENVFMGDGSGNIYRLEGVGGQDGGSADLVVERTSGTISLPADREFDLNGYIAYRKTGAGTVTLTIQRSGFEIRDDEFTITIENPTVAIYWGNFYWNDSTNNAYWGALFEKRVTRQKLAPPGSSAEFSIKISYEGSGDIFIEEVYLQFKALAPA